MNNLEIKAVLTGDIVDSRKLNEEKRKRLYQTLLNLSTQLQQTYPQEILYPLGIFRGDGWQLIVEQPEKALAVGLMIRSYIRSCFPDDKIDSRVAIGLGKISFIPEENAAAGDGAAYILSGHLLESMNHERMAIDSSEDQNGEVLSGIKSIVSLIDQIVTCWSPSQAQASYLAMKGKNQNEIAREWNPKAISQVAVSKNLKSAGWENINQNIEVFELLVNKMVHPREV